MFNQLLTTIMKKNLWMLAAALCMTACSQNEDIVIEQPVTDSDFESPDGRLIIQLGGIESRIGASVGVTRAPLDKLYDETSGATTRLGIFALATNDATTSTAITDANRTAAWGDTENYGIQAAVTAWPKQDGSDVKPDGLENDLAQKITLYKGNAANGVYYYPMQKKYDYTFYGYAPYQADQTISAAKPKIANYHFTTLYPNLGVIYVDEGVSFVMADIPGIIEGAAEGAGLGHDFLRHIDRCRLLVHIVDVSGSEDRDPIEDFEKINAELRDYSPELAERPMIVAANKCDLIPEGSDNLERLRAYVTERGYPFYEISAATTQGTKQLMRVIAGRLRELPPVTVYEPEYVKPLAEAGEADALSIEHMDDLWVVSGKWLQKLLNDINFDDYESRMYFDRQLRKSGLFDRLEEMGIEDGDTVSIYDFEFEYER